MQKKVVNRFIIGNQPEFFYVGQIMQYGAMFDDFILLSTRKNLPKMEYVILKLQYWGLSQSDKVMRIEDLHGKKIEVVQVTLEKIPALKSIREELSE